ncbi:hypothetical protein E2986_13661 [Frieseomelitta varia]|uniref:Uncharacterized protein n=1 Tax=Frieseomelitta varia TaxID=561572 RepID=A0A833RY44_9HYME|nr:hypothetical protein E2986_13661 [Frieseomelitta varia]
MSYRRLIVYGLVTRHGPQSVASAVILYRRVQKESDKLLCTVTRHGPQSVASAERQNTKPKKRRFHPLRGLRKIFRRKSRGAADARLVAGHADHRDAELVRLPREDITDRHPAGRPEEARSRSASELLTDSSDRER